MSQPHMEGYLLYVTTSHGRAREMPTPDANVRIHLPHDDVEAKHIRCPSSLVVGVDLRRHPEVRPHLVKQARTQR